MKFSGKRRHTIPGKKQSGKRRHRFSCSFDRHGKIPFQRKKAASLRHSSGRHQVSDSAVVKISILQRYYGFFFLKKKKPQFSIETVYFPTTDVTQRPLRLFGDFF